MFRRLVMPAALAILVLSGCSPSSDSIPMINGRVDDFEDGDRTNLLGHEWEAISGGQETQATLFVGPGGQLSSVYQLTLGGMRPYGSTGDQVSGIRSLLADPQARSGPTSVDVTAYDGLEISMKGTGGSYILQLGTTEITDFDYYNAYVQVEEFWGTYRIPFEEFNQEGFGRPHPWTGNNVSHVAIYANLTGPFTLDVDNIRFYSDDEGVLDP